MIDKEIIAVFHYDDKGSKRCGGEPYRYAEEIIRCKECKYRQNPYAPKWCYEMSKETEPDDFCSYGERKSE